MEQNPSEIVVIQFYDTSTETTSQSFQVPVKIRRTQLLELLDRKSTLYYSGHIITNDLLSVLPKNFNREETIVIKTSDEKEQKAAVYCSSSFSGHESAVLAVACDGNDVFTVGGDATVRKWDFDMKLQKKISKEHTHWIQVVKILNNMVFTGGMDAQVCVFDKDLNLLCTIRGHSNGITGIGEIEEMIVTSSRDKTVRFWQKKDKNEKIEYECVYTYAHDGIVNGIYVHNSRIYSYSKDSSVKIYEKMRYVTEIKTNSSINTLKAHEKDVYIGCEDGSVYKNNSVIAKQNNLISSIDVSQNGIYFATGSFSKKTCVYTTDGDLIAEYMHFDSVYKVKMVSYMVYSSSKDKTIKIFSLKTKKVVSTLICKDEVYDFDLHGEKVVAACKDGRVYFFE
ncbi:Notchless-like WD40 repeat-containing protein [Trachipleistophora hominis]|uniref:Notchless-like WD40 repeat-containing protein n=1 Tax=Trachipleistophora hominis TaxID=72359 RepID=L7JUY9_TRAHO|nr:Notchless-like WD40 repeat-containing protein [Trachipleistophora hominis]